MLTANDRRERLTAFERAPREGVGQFRRQVMVTSSGKSEADLGERRDCAAGIDAKLSMSWTVPNVRKVDGSSSGHATLWRLDSTGSAGFWLHRLPEVHVCAAGGASFGGRFLHGISL